MGLSGHCLCGQVTYTAGDPVLVGNDHCDACQRQTGSAYSLVFVTTQTQTQTHSDSAVVKTETLKVSGPIKEFKKKGDSGKDVTRAFCSNCGSPIYHAPDAAPEITAIKAGTLEADQKRALKPEHEIYACDKLPFLTEKLEKVHDKMP